MKLFPFQIQAADQIATRCIDYFQAPSTTRGKVDPFLQVLQAVTGSGKTPILASAVHQISDYCLATYGKPALVLWTSKASAVVGQTKTNFDPGGKYQLLLTGFNVTMLSDVSIPSVRALQSPTLVISTVAAFNRENKDGLKVHQVRPDEGNISLWDALRNRDEAVSLIIVYDESHNNTDNQVDLLLELRPRAILLSSATPELTPRLQSLARLGTAASDAERKDIESNLLTLVSTKDAVDAQLIKPQIRVTDYDNPEEYIVLDLLKEFRATETLGVPARVQPKCIYVCTTNVPGDENKSFTQRKARPIVLWRTLTQKGGIPANEIAVYCNLKGRHFPEDFHLVTKFEELQAGQFKHIIFNLGLQEGWDDPECYFAYIDKDLNSQRQITQIIGRVLRQPRAKYLAHEALNTAHFFIRCPSESFDEIIEGIKADLGAAYGYESSAGGETRIKVLAEKKSTRPEPFPVRKPEYSRLANLQAVMEERGNSKMKEALSKLPDYTISTEDTAHAGEQRVRKIDMRTGDVVELPDSCNGTGQIVEIGEYLRKQLRRISPEAADNIDPLIVSSGRFAARACLRSIATQVVADIANAIANVYSQYVQIECDTCGGEFQFEPFQPSTSAVERFKNSLHVGYDKLNKDELPCARDIDKLGFPWVRNPSRTGYGIPLPVVGVDSKVFYPDFIIFAKKVILCVDPKGGHLVNEAAKRKLSLDIPLGKGRVLRTVLITPGKWVEKEGGVVAENSEGVTKFSWERPKLDHFPNYHSCLVAACKHK